MKDIDVSSFSTLSGVTVQIPKQFRSATAFSEWAAAIGKTPYGDEYQTIDYRGETLHIVYFIVSAGTPHLLVVIARGRNDTLSTSYARSLPFTGKPHVCGDSPKIVLPVLGGAHVEIEPLEIDNGWHE